jgi:glutamine synthetase
MTQAADNAALADDLLADGARNLLVTLVDNSGATRAKNVPRDRIPSASTKGVGLSPMFAVMGINGVITSSPHFGGPSGDMRLIPDLRAATCIDRDAGLWWAPVDQCTQELEPVAACQREALRRQHATAADLGLDFVMTFELEFTTLRGDRDDPEVAHHGPPYGLLAFLDLEDFILDLSDQFAGCGLEPELVHPEYGPGQVEFSLAPTGALAAADRQVLARLLTHRVARRHGLRVSFSPMTAPDAVGNGCHLHFSARDGAGNVFAGEGATGMRDAGAAMIAGLVEHLPAVTGIFAPSAISYERLTPGHWSGAYACWGVENRECAVRYIPGTVTHRDAAANCEIKVADSTSNPYLVAATVLAMALDGVRTGSTPPPPVAVDPQTLVPEQQLELGVRPLPRDLATALGSLEQSSFARAALGEEVIDAFVATRRADAAEVEALDRDARIAAYRWLY